MPRPSHPSRTADSASGFQSVARTMDGSDSRPKAEIVRQRASWCSALVSTVQAAPGSSKAFSHRRDSLAALRLLLFVRRRMALLSYVPSLHGRYPLLRYYGRSDPGGLLRCRPPWFPDSRHSDFRPFCLQPSAVPDQTRSTPSTLAALFCSGFAGRSQARRNRRPNRVHYGPLPGGPALRTGRSLSVASHPRVSPRCSYFQLLALQCRPGQGLTPLCLDALSGALGAPARAEHRPVPEPSLMSSPSAVS